MYMDQDQGENTPETYIVSILILIVPEPES